MGKFNPLWYYIRVAVVCVGIDSDNGLVRDWYQDILWTSIDLSSIRHCGFLSELKIILFEKNVFGKYILVGYEYNLEEMSMLLVNQQEYYGKATSISRLKIFLFLAWPGNGNQKPWYYIDFLGFTGKELKFPCPISVENERKCNYIYVSQNKFSTTGVNFFLFGNSLGHLRH